MSIKALQAVLDESKHKGSALLLMIVLANYAHDDGTYAFPSVNTMTKYTRLGKRNVFLLLNKLKASGELVEMGIHNSGTIIYRLVLPGLQKGDVKFTPPLRSGVQRRSPRDATPITGGVQPATPEPLSNHQQPSEDQNPDQNQETKEDHHGRRLQELRRQHPHGSANFDVRLAAATLADADPAKILAHMEGVVAEAKKKAAR